MAHLKLRYIETIAVLLLAASLAAIGCRGRGPEGPTYGCTAEGGQLQIQFPSGGAPIVCPSFPNTTPTGQPSWDYFAWNSFIAANWPALDPSANSNQRGFPDLKKNFATAKHDDLLVWETFKEKRELFQPFFNPALKPPNGPYYDNGNNTTPAVPPGPWNQAVNYGPLDPRTNKPYDFPVCASSKERYGPATRRLPQLGKLGIDGNSEPDSLDETVEVGSEALESPSDLCLGHTDNPCGGTPAPNCTCVQGLEVGPRVWKGKPTKPKPQPVRYEVKINYDYYNYVQSNKYYNDSIAATAASAGNLTLPFRTSAAQGPVNSGATAVLSYDAQGCIDNYSSVTPTSNVTPCQTGSIQIKTAWIPLINGEDPKKYHTAAAAVFKTQRNPSNPQQTETCIDYDPSVLYGLVGIHIIQRIHQGAGGGSANPQGGTFIFATWEHVDNDKAGFTYANFLPPQTAKAVTPNPPYIPPVSFYPLPGNALAVKRRFPILSGTANVNTAVHNAIRKIDPNSVWLNYQLIGTQFQPIALPTEQPAVPPFPTTLPNPDPTNIGQNVYLANSVVETNDGLQLFRGLPPNVLYSSIAKPYQKTPPILTGNSSLTAYARDNANLVFSPLNQGPGKGIQGYTMGGCMGCHGVAQLKGYSFSFILLEGQGGADVDTEEDFTVAPLQPTDFNTDFTSDVSPP